MKKKELKEAFDKLSKENREYYHEIRSLKRKIEERDLLIDALNYKVAYSKLYPIQKTENDN